MPLTPQLPRRAAQALLLAGCLCIGGNANAYTGMTAAEIAAAILIQAQEVLLNTAIGTDAENTRGTVDDTSVNEQNNQREIYNEQMKREQQPTPFCPDDQKITGSIAKARSQASYSRAAESLNRYGAGQPSAIPAGKRSAPHAGPISVRNPVRFEKEKNDQLTAILESGSLKCDPRIAPPIGGIATGAGSEVRVCNLDEIEAFVRLVTGRKPIPKPPASVEKTALGQYLISETDNYNARMSIVEQALEGTVNEEINLLLQAYQKLSESPSIKEINQMSGTGGVERTEAFQQQIRIQLQIQFYKELLQNNRILAVQAAQSLDDHYLTINKILGNLNSR